MILKNIILIEFQHQISVHYDGFGSLTYIRLRYFNRGTNESVSKQNIFTIVAEFFICVLYLRF